jgi:hypothetical protein
MSIELGKNLDFDEFVACRNLYEVTTGEDWTLSNKDTKIIWVASFEQAKKYFQKEGI